MEALYFTAAAVLLYVVADAVLNGVERRMGRRLKHRSVIFFAIILVMSLVTFEVLRRVT